MVWRNGKLELPGEGFPSWSLGTRGKGFADCGFAGIRGSFSTVPGVWVPPIPGGMTGVVDFYPIV